MSSMESVVGRLQEIEAEQDRIKSDHVRKRGWSYHCDSPGSVWYWEKTVAGRRWTCWNLDSAFDFQCMLEACGLDN